MMDLFTRRDAKYLRYGERKLYELIADGRITCTKVTGKWLLHGEQLDQWVLSGLMRRPAGMGVADPPLISG